MEYKIAENTSLTFRIFKPKDMPQEEFEKLLASQKSLILDFFHGLAKDNLLKWDFSTKDFLEGDIEINIARTFWQTSQKVSAVKHLMNKKGWGLKDSKDYCEANFN